MIGESKKAKELVNAFLSRNEDAIRQTSVLFGAYLFRIALNITGNQEDAEECVQDAYLSAWNSIPPEEPENLKAWLSMVVRRKAIDRYRADYYVELSGRVWGQADNYDICVNTSATGEDGALFMIRKAVEGKLVQMEKTAG